jgi:hypothetical protein
MQQREREMMWTCVFVVISSLSIISLAAATIVVIKLLSKVRQQLPRCGNILSTGLLHD